MNLSIQTSGLLRGLVTGVVVLAGLSGCSRSDRSDAGRDTAQSGVAMGSATDTGTSAATKPSGAGSEAGAAPQANSTMNSSDSSTASAPSRPQSTARTGASQDTSGTNQAPSGYRAMQRDSAAPSNSP